MDLRCGGRSGTKKEGGASIARLSHLVFVSPFFHGTTTDAPYIDANVPFIFIGALGVHGVRSGWTGSF